MSHINRREFLYSLAGLGASVLGAGALVALGGGSRARARVSLDDFSPHVREARFYIGLGVDATRCQVCHSSEPSRVLYCHVPHSAADVQCELCPKGCVIADGHRGHCRVRENRGGKLYTLVYGNPCAVHVDPIEKKPFYHFLPGTPSFSLATAGCNLRCLYCQNWMISQSGPEEVSSSSLMPEEVVEEALREGCPTIAFTYSEPTVFYEYMLDTARLARQKGIRPVVVSAGYINPKPLRALCAAVDAIKIDFKGYSEEFYQRVCEATLDPVLRTMRIIKEEGVHLEIVNLVVPTLNDTLEQFRGLCRWILDELGPDVPLHFTRFHPMYKLTHLPMTPVETLEQAHAIAKEMGLHYVYVGNVPGHAANHTYCPHCGRAVIVRQGFLVAEMLLEQGRCRFCGYPLAGVWQ